MSGAVHVEFPSGPSLAVLRLDNPGRRNAVSAAMWREVGAFAEQVPNHPHVRVVMLRGTGGVFSAGADISGFAAARSGAADAVAYDDLVEFTCRAVEAIPQPTVALIEGPCIGAGASLAASCDLRVASEGAHFAVPAARLGLGYDPRGVARFLKVFGPAVGDLLLTAERLAAARAFALGAVHRLLPAEAVEAAAFALALRLAENAPLTLAAAKLTLRALRAQDGAMLEAATALCARADASADYAEGRAAFAEKRHPRFTGA